MAPLPKRRHSSARSGKRRSAIKLSTPTYVKCANCGKMTLPHTVCPECGFYSGRLVVAPKVKTTVKKIEPVATEDPESKRA